MNNKIFNLSFTFTLIFTLLFIGCSEQEATEPTEENTLLYSSFEKNGKFSADGWTLPLLSDSSYDIPSGGGTFSLVLEASDPPETYAKIKVPVKTQYNNYRFTFWSKSNSVTSNIYGRATLILTRNGTNIKSLNVSVDDIIWKSYSIQDTFSVAVGDSFEVRLSAGFSQLFSGQSYFDLCTLYGID
jgi:hypothetical protein